MVSFYIDDEIVKGPTLAEDENLYLTGSVKSPPATEVFFASLGLYLLVAWILFALTWGFYSLFGKISSKIK